MKKYLLFGVLFFITSCNGNTSDGSISATKFNYCGHSYIRFKIYASYADNVIHDPDCLCEIVDSLRF